MVYYTYIVECLDGTLYTGSTNNLDRRMAEHKSGKGAKYIRMKGFKKCLGYWEHPTRKEAMKMERHLKSLSHNKKLELLITIQSSSITKKDNVYKC